MIADYALIDLGYYDMIEGEYQKAVPLWEGALAVRSDWMTRQFVLSRLCALYYQLGFFTQAEAAATEIWEKEYDQPSVMLVADAFRRIDIDPGDFYLTRFMEGIIEHIRNK